MKITIKRNTVVVAVLGILIGTGSYSLRHGQSSPSNAPAAAQTTRNRSVARLNPRLARIVAEAAANSAAQRAHTLMVLQADHESAKNLAKSKMTNTVANAR